MDNVKTFKTAQEVFKDDFLEEEGQETNATINIFNFLRREGTPLSKDQMSAIMLLEENGLHDISSRIHQNRQFNLTKKDYDDTFAKMTLADRIKGNAKMSHLVKETMSNPAVNINNAHGQAVGKTAHNPSTI